MTRSYASTVLKLSDQEVHDELHAWPTQNPSLTYLDALRAEHHRRVTDLRSHEPPRNSGEGTAVNGPMPLEGEDDANATA